MKKAAFIFLACLGIALLWLLPGGKIVLAQQAFADTPTDTPSDTPTDPPTATPTLDFTATPTAVGTDTSIPTITDTPVPTLISLDTVTPTETASPTATPTDNSPLPYIPDDVLIVPPTERESAQPLMMLAASSAPSSHLPGFYDTSVFMHGTVTVGVILPQCSGSSCTEAPWTTTQINNVKSQIQTGLSWWTSQAASHSDNVSFVYDWKVGVQINMEPINKNSSDTSWEQAAMTALGYSGDTIFGQVYSYVNALRDANHTDWAFVIFVADSLNNSSGTFPDSKFAYSYLGGPYLVMTYDNDGWGISNMQRVTAHETGHTFLAGDQYSGACSDPTKQYGYLGIANVDCGTSANSIMKDNAYNLLTSTASQIGWRDSNSNGINDILDTNPAFTLSVHTPNPTTETRWAYSGTVYDSPRAHSSCGSSCWYQDITLNTISSVKYRIDGAQWTNLSADDGIFDSDVESISFSTGNLATGQHLIEVQAINSIGNSTTWSDSVLVTTCSTLTTVAYPSYGGTVTVSPAPNCDTGKYFNGTSITVKAAPRSGASFQNWSGGTSGTLNPTTFIMNGSTTVQANFFAPPGMPALLAPANAAFLTTPTPLLDWSDSSPSADHYEIKIATDSGCNSVVQSRTNLTSSNFTPSALDPNSMYYWQVRAVNSIGQASAWTAVRSMRIALSPPTLAAPSPGTTELTVKPSFSWNQVDDASSYTLNVALYSNFSALVVNVTTTANNITSPTALTGGKIFYWRVKANSPWGSSAWSDTRQFTGANPPSVPTLASPASNALLTNLSPKLDWNNSSVPLGTTFDHYRLQVATDLAFVNLILDQNITGLSTNSDFTLASPLSSNSRYYWRVSAYNTTEQYSAWSAVWSFRTALDAPILTAPALNEIMLTTRPTFTWGSVTGATSYNLQASVAANFGTLAVNITASTSSYTPTSGLIPGRLLYWRVRSNGTNGPSLWSAAGQFTSANPPSTPGLISPANNALTTNYLPTLDWNNSTVPVGTVFDHYHVQVSTESAFASPLIDQDVPRPVTNSYFTFVSNLTPNTRYYWRVNSFNSDHQYSQWSSVRSFRTALTPPVLSAPANGSTALFTRPAFSWIAVSGATSYTLQTSVYNNFSTTSLNVTVAGTSYIPGSNLVQGKLIYWRVKSNGANGPSLWSAIGQFTSANPPSTPGLVSPANNTLLTNLQPRLDWNNSILPAGTNFSRYHIQIAADAGFSSLVIDQDVPGLITNSEFTPSTPLTANTKYYWRVNANNDSGQYSAWSAVWYFRTALNKPNLVSPLNASAVSCSPVIFDWSDVTGATSYTLRYSSNSAFTTFTTVGVVPSQLSRTLPANAVIYWRVQVNGVNGPSLWSDTRSLTCTP